MQRGSEPAELPDEPGPGGRVGIVTQDPARDGLPLDAAHHHASSAEGRAGGDEEQLRRRQARVVCDGERCRLSVQGAGLCGPARRVPAQDQRGSRPVGADCVERPRLL